MSPRHRVRHFVALAIAALLLLAGIGAFVGVDSAKRDAEDAIDDFYRETNFANLTVNGGHIRAFARTAENVDGVENVDVRTTASLAVWVHDGKTKLEGQIIGIPDDNQVNQLSIDEGKAPGAMHAIAERHTAEDLDLSSGDSVELLGLGAVTTLKLSGVGTSPEYLVPAASQQQLITARGTFAVLFMPEALAAEIAGVGGVRQALVTYADGADHGDVTSQLRDAARQDGAYLVEPRNEQPSEAVLREELTGYREAAIVAPWLLLVASVLVAALSIGTAAPRASRSWGGLLRAALVPALVGTVAGLVVGLVVQRVLLSSLESTLGLPSASASFHLNVLLIGILLGALAAVVAATVAVLARRASRDAQGDRAFNAGIAAFLAGGIALALVVVIAPAGLIDSVEATLDDASSLELADAQVAFAAQVNAEELGQLRNIDGVAVAEKVPSGNVVVSKGDRSYQTSLEAFAPDTELQRFESPSGNLFALPDSGMLVSQALAELLDAQPGDELELTIIGGDIPASRVELAATTSNTLGNLAFISIGALKDAVGTPPPFAGGLFNTAALQYEDGADEGKIQAAVTALDDVEVYVPVSDDINQVSDARPLLTRLTIGLLVFGAIVGFLTLLNVGLAAPAVLGARRATLARVLLTIVLPVVAGTVVGAIGGTMLANHLVSALESSLVNLEHEVTWATYVGAIGLQLLVVAVVVAIARRLDRSAAEPAPA